MYTYLIIILKIARKINRNVEFPGFSRSFIRLSVNPHWKLRLEIDPSSHYIGSHKPEDLTEIFRFLFELLFLLVLKAAA